MRSRFAGGDPEYLRSEQYGSTDRLAARQRLHARYSTAAVRWFPWMVAEIPWRAGPVLEVGCGPGNLWDEGRPPVDGPVLLTDPSGGMVDAALGRARGAGYRAHGVVAGAQALPVADAGVAHVISNHMLYHVPRPLEAVREMARVVADDGLVTVATNGRGHMAELKRIEHAVFGTTEVEHTVAAFGLVSGRPMLDEWFAQVELRRHHDDLRVTDPGDVVAYLTSYPPGEDATAEQRADLAARVAAAFEGDGTLTIHKDVGLFLCRGPRRR